MLDTTEMLTIPEAANRTKLSENTIRRHVLAGTVQSTTENGKYLIPITELPKLPKPRNTGNRLALAQKERSTQDAPFLPMGLEILAIGPQSVALARQMMHQQAHLA